MGLVAGHRCPEVGAWDQGETMWIGIVGLWECEIVAWDQGETFDHNHVEESEDGRMFNSLPPSDPRASVPERDDRRRGSSHLYWSRPGSFSLPLGICCFRFVSIFQVKVFTESAFMELAVEQFLGKSEEDVKVDF